MNRQPVKSSNIASVGYDPESRTLEVEFKNGKVYRYLDVPEPVRQELMRAGSIGKFLNENIIGKYREMRMEDGRITAPDKDEEDGSEDDEEKTELELVHLRQETEDCYKELHKRRERAALFEKVVAENTALVEEEAQEEEEYKTLAAEFESLTGNQAQSLEEVLAGQEDEQWWPAQAQNAGKFYIDEEDDQQQGLPGMINM